MIEQKTETSKEVQRFKTLRLVTPDLANKLGIPTESPVFVSPALNFKRECQACGVTYKPLIYQTEYQVKAHHFHQFDEGGIYHLHQPVILEGYFNPVIQSFGTGWLAMLEPVGQNRIIKEGFGGYIMSSEETIVRSIRAFCVNEHCMSSAKSKELIKGVVVVKDEHLGLMLPVCGLNEHPQYISQAKYTFKIEEGQVLFSAI